MDATSGEMTRRTSAQARTFSRRVRVYTPAFLATEKPDLARTLELGDKIIVYSGWLRELDSILENGEPLVFSLHNEVVGRTVHVGVLEFSGDQHGIAFVPAWVMHGLAVEDGTTVQLSRVTLPRMAFLRLQPRDSSFAEHEVDPTGVLEEALRSFTAATEGQALVVHTPSGAAYEFNVLEVRPAGGAVRAACLVGADIELAIEPPDADHDVAGDAGCFPSSSTSPILSRDATIDATAAYAPLDVPGDVAASNPSAAVAQGDLETATRTSEAPLPPLRSSPPFSNASRPPRRPSPLSAGSPRLGGAASQGIATPFVGGHGQAHRPLQVGEAIVSEALTAADSAHYFTLNFRFPGRAIVFTLESAPLTTADSCDVAPAAPLKSTATIGASGLGSGGVAVKVPLQTTQSPLPSFSSVANVAAGSSGSSGHRRSDTAADISREFLTSDALNVSTKAMASLGGSVRARADSVHRDDSEAAVAASHITVTSVPLQPHAQPPRHVEADLWLSPSLTRPGPRTGFSWSDTRIAQRKVAVVLPDDGRLPVPNEHGAIVVYIAVTPYGGPVTYSLRVDACDVSEIAGLQNALRLVSFTVPADCAPASLAVPDTSHTTRGAEPPLPAGTVRCKSCSQAVPAASLTMHEAYCVRNNVVCTVCGAVTQRAAATRGEGHIHCPQCPAVLPTHEAIAKHAVQLHVPAPCAGCGQLVAPSATPVHAATICPARQVPCTYCRMALPARALESHEAACGGRSVPCEVCGRLQPRKRMARHLALVHAIGDVSAFSGFTPQTPFVMSGSTTSGLEMPTDFTLGPVATQVQGATSGTHASSPTIPVSTGMPSLANDAQIEVSRVSQFTQVPINGIAATVDGTNAVVGDINHEERRAAVSAAAAAAAATATLRFGADAVECPSCHAPQPTFDDLQVHVLTECPNLGSALHAAIIEGMTGGGDTGAHARMEAALERPSNSVTPLEALGNRASTEAVRGDSNAEHRVATDVDSAGDVGQTAVSAATEAPTTGERHAIAVIGSASLSSTPASVVLNRWCCPCCSQRFRQEDDVQVHLLTEECPTPWDDISRAMASIRRAPPDATASTSIPWPFASSVAAFAADTDDDVDDDDDGDREEAEGEGSAEAGAGGSASSHSSSSHGADRNTAEAESEGLSMDATAAAVPAFPLVSSHEHRLSNDVFSAAARFGDLMREMVDDDDGDDSATED